MKKLRKLTYQTGNNYVYQHPPYPEITIGGKFLVDKYGWKVGDKVEVEYLKNKIVIKTGGKNGC